MNKPLILVNSITYAMKGRDILLRKGFAASLKKVPKNKHPNGCAYAIFVENRASEAAEILNKSAIKVLGRLGMEDII